MNNWLKRLLEFLAWRGRTRTPRRTDWRGRPVAENTDGAIPSVSHPGADLYATLRPPAFPGESYQGGDGRPPR
jgi:hypothetical protein